MTSGTVKRFVLGAVVALSLLLGGSAGVDAGTSTTPLRGIDIMRPVR